MSAVVPLLLPIDTKAPSLMAVELAALMAPPIADEVLLLHVSEHPPRLDLLAELHALAEPIRDTGLPVRLRMVRGQPEERIPEVAVERNAKWILMGTSGEGFRDGGGSTTRTVMRCSPVPVIAVRPGVPPARSRDPIALVGADSGHLARSVARALAESHAVGIREFNPDLQPLDGLPPGVSVRMTVAPFDPDGGMGPWCRTLLTTDPRPVLLVSGGQRECARAGAG